VKEFDAFEYIERDENGDVDESFLVFRKKLNITKNLKIEKFIRFDTEGWIIYKGKYRNNTDWEDVNIEVEIDDYKITANIVFLETGEIRQAQLRFDIYART